MWFQVEIVSLTSYWIEVRLTQDFSQSDLDCLFVRTIAYDTVFWQTKRMERRIALYTCIPVT